MKADSAIRKISTAPVLAQTGIRSSSFGCRTSATRGMPPGGAVTVAIYALPWLGHDENTLNVRTCVISRYLAPARSQATICAGVGSSVVFDWDRAWRITVGHG